MLGAGRQAMREPSVQRAVRDSLEQSLRDTREIDRGNNIYGWKATSAGDKGPDTSRRARGVDDLVGKKGMLQKERVRLGIFSGRQSEKDLGQGSRHMVTVLAVSP